MGSFLPTLLFKLRGLDSYPGGTFTHCSCQPSLDAHLSLLIQLDERIGDLALVETLNDENRVYRYRFRARRFRFAEVTGMNS